MVLLLTVGVQVIDFFILSRTRVVFGSLDLDPGAGHPVKDGIPFDDLHTRRVKQLQDEVEAGTKEVYFQGTALRHQVNDVLFVFLAAHERTHHLLELRKLLLKDFELLLRLHVFGHQVGNFVKDGREDGVLAGVVALRESVLDLLDVEKACLHGVLA